MLENYLRIAWRNIVRNKVYSSISILMSNFFLTLFLQRILNA